METESQREQDLPEQLARWKFFISTQCWKDLQRWSEAQKVYRTQQVMHGRDENGALISNEDSVGLRGEYRGIDLFMRYPHILIDEIEATLEARKLKENQNVSEEFDES